MSLKRRGFVGPLGDDLPSIFPIVAAIILFAGTLVLANDLVGAKNKALETRQAALGLSYIVTERGLIDNRTEFEKTTCDDFLKKYASSNRVKFLVTIKRYCDKIVFFNPQATLNPDYARQSPWYLEKSDVDKQGQTWAYCTNVDRPPVTGFLDLPKKTMENAIVLTYPLAVPCPVVEELPTNGLGLVNVIAWK